MRSLSLALFLLAPAIVHADEPAIEVQPTDPKAAKIVLIAGRRDRRTRTRSGGSGQINEIKPPEDYEEGRGDNGGQGGPPTPNRRPQRPATPMKKNYMGSAGGGGLNGFAQNQRNASSWENLQRRSSFMPPNQQTPRQRFTA